MTPKFFITVKDVEGLSHSFYLQHEDIKTVEDAYTFTKNEVLEGSTVFVVVPK